MVAEPKVFKLFVSSPSDVMVERRRVEAVASRLNGEFAGVARLEVVRWETELYQAHTTFQTQIARSTDCDIVIGILKWRLGTPLPPDFGERLPGGEPFPSGTAYEILTAVAKRQAGGPLPDVFVFRYGPSSPPVAVDDPNREGVERDWQTLKRFFQDWFLTERGSFKAAFNPYVSEDDFEAQLEKLLRKWLSDKVAGRSSVRWPIEVKGSPFRGLDAFGAKHAPVFFGRSRDIVRAVEALREAGGRGAPFLLLIGPSGSGKSSLAGAGVLPRLTTPGVIAEVDLWRVAAMRPSDSPDGPLASLAAALLKTERDLSRDDEGRGPALPEIAQGDSRTPADLAAVLGADGKLAERTIVNALSRVGAAERQREGYGRELRVDLALLIDQFDEIFSAAVSDAARADFVRALTTLNETRRVWVIVTLRADLYARFIGEPGLKALKERGASYDLAPPDAANLAEIVRAPAEAAGLAFETDPASRETLDHRILSEADRPDMLPLIQLALARLFEARVTRDGVPTLSSEVYASLGGLQGIVDEVGEKALQGLSDDAKARLPRLLRQLALPADIEGGALTVRAASIETAAPDAPGRELIEALTRARLLTTAVNAGVAQVRLAHQRVLEDWRRARQIVAESADFYRVRADIEESRRKWQAGGKRGELLLARGLPLAEAESLAARYAQELSADERAYIAASRKRANRGLTIASAAAAAFALVALGAGAAAKIAVDRGAAEQAARALAEQNRAQAEQEKTAAEKARALAERDWRLAETRRAQSAVRLFVADELLSDGGKGEQLRLCLGSTLRLDKAPPPSASREFVIGRWHVDQDQGSTDVDWRDDGQCVLHSAYGVAGMAFDTSKDSCAWSYVPVSGAAFAIEFRDALATGGALKRMPFKIVSPIHIYNTEKKYDAYRVACPSEELRRLRADIAELEDHIAHDSGDEKLKLALAYKHQQIAFAEYSSKNWSGAIDAAKAAVALTRPAADAKPSGSGDLLYQVGWELQFIADCESKIGALEAARADYRDALVYLRGWVAANGGRDPGPRAYLAQVLARAAASDNDAAHALLAEALALVEALQREGKLSLEQTEWPAQLSAELAKHP